MSIRAHIQTKHEIEYGNSYLGYLSDELLSWLTSHKVYVCESGGYEWEIDREGLEGLKDEDYNDLNDFGLEDDAKSEVVDFVRDCLATNTGNYVYVSWF